MENFVIAIPSYKRPESQATVEYISGMGVPKERIYIFTQTQDDYEAYQKYAGVSQIVYAEAKSVTEARNNILCNLDGNILMMDDDIRRISIMKAGNLEPITEREMFAKIINECFEKTKKARAEIFGVYPVYNEYFMSPTISTKVTVNTVMGFAEGFDKKFDEQYTTKEDIELCSRILHNGGKVLRFNYLAVDAKHRTNAGGCYDVWHSDENRKTVKRLCVAYPEILAPQAKKPEEVRVIAKDVKIPIRRSK